MSGGKEAGEGRRGEVGREWQDEREGGGYHVGVTAGRHVPVNTRGVQHVSSSPCREDLYRLVSGHTVTKGLKGAQATFDIYTESWAQDPSQENMKKTVVAFETDILFLIPTEMALAQHRAHAK